MVERRPEDLWLSTLHQPLHSTSIIRVQVQLIEMLQMFSPLNNSEIKVWLSLSQWSSLQKWYKSKLIWRLGLSFPLCPKKKTKKPKDTKNCLCSVWCDWSQAWALFLWILLKHHITLWLVEVAWGPGFSNQSVPIYLLTFIQAKNTFPLPLCNATVNDPCEAEVLSVLLHF